MQTTLTVQDQELIERLAKKVATGIAADMMTAHQLNYGHLPVEEIVDTEEPVVDESVDAALDTPGNTDAEERETDEMPTNADSAPAVVLD